MKKYLTIKQLREIKEIDQKIIYEELYISQSSYSRKENGERNFTMSEIEKLSEIFNVKSDYLKVNKIPAFIHIGEFEMSQDHKNDVVLIFKMIDDQKNLITDILNHK